ncbi:transposase [Colletotrichum tofieldiae]|uniref:Transposase n=1 Tax=Colletotrichum tofieldiae TaxID=708197 RepID=A0A161VEL6_9PEZI|nr:transposase [Colletotrichum tofieldiae]
MPHRDHQPPTSNYHNIFNPYPNHFIFSTYLPYSLMVQYTEDELNQALEAIANGVSSSYLRHPKDHFTKPHNWHPDEGISI